MWPKAKGRKSPSTAANSTRSKKRPSPAGSAPPPTRTPIRFGRAKHREVSMGLPRPAEARLYYRAAKQRFDDAQLLLEAGRTTGAVYLAGYTVECYLKALLLANVTSGLREEVLAKFCGSIAHDIEWLGALYRRHVGSAVPKTVTRHLSRVASWSTDMRYQSGVLRRRDADEFLAAVIVITTWADGRM